jgi:hypothetical protein
MTSIAFLLLAVGISVLGSLVLWLRYRQRPYSVESGVDDFAREMRALAPEEETGPPGNPHGQPSRGHSSGV